MIRPTISVAAGLLACACSHHAVAVLPAPFASQPVVEQKPAINLSIVEIKLERTECYGWCPNYEVTIAGNGEVRYTGRSFVKDIGEQIGTVPKATVQALLKKFNDADFLRLNNDYSELVTDLPSTYLTLKSGDKTNRVRNYWLGDHIDPWGKEVPDWQVHEQLDALAAAIDHAVNIEQWIGTEDERRTAHEQSRDRGNPGSTSPR